MTDLKAKTKEAVAAGNLHLAYLMTGREVLRALSVHTGIQIKPVSGQGSQMRDDPMYGVRTVRGPKTLRALIDLQGLTAEQREAIEPALWQLRDVGVTYAITMARWLSITVRA